MLYSCELQPCMTLKEPVSKGPAEERLGAASPAELARLLPAGPAASGPPASGPPGPALCLLTATATRRIKAPSNNVKATRAANSIFVEFLPRSCKKYL